MKENVIEREREMTSQVRKCYDQKACVSFFFQDLTSHSFRSAQSLQYLSILHCTMYNVHLIHAILREFIFFFAFLIRYRFNGSTY